MLDFGGAGGVAMVMRVSVSQAVLESSLDLQLLLPCGTSRSDWRASQQLPVI